MVNGVGEKAQSAISAIESSYQKEVFDEFVEPTVICNGENPVATIGKDDSVIAFCQPFQFFHKRIRVTGTTGDNQLFICFDILERFNQIPDTFFRYQSTKE